MGLIQRRQFIKELAEHDPVPSQDLIDEAEELIKAALLRVASEDLYLENRLLIKMTDKAYTSSIPTAAITAKPGTDIVLAINPDFIVNGLAGPDHVGNIAFVLGGHEIGGHLWDNHLFDDNPSSEARTIAKEVCANDRAMKRMSSSMPEVWIDPDNPENEAALKLGDPNVLKKLVEEQGVNPRKVWEKLKDDLRKQGLDYPTYQEFVQTDEVCHSWLLKMSKPPKAPRRPSGNNPWELCPHAGPDGSPLPLDPAEVEEVANDVLEAAVRAAQVEGDQRAKAAIKELMDATEGSEKADKVWGQIGAGELFGGTPPKPATSNWKKWLTRVTGRLTKPGMQLNYPARLAVVDAQLNRDPMLTYRGKKTIRRGIVVTDSSGSMFYEPLMAQISAMLGTEADLDVEYFCADTDIYPYTPGEKWRGGGGTNFECIDTYVRSMARKPDFVIIITDGYVNPVVPGGDPRKVVWLITHDGSDWPRTHTPAMPCYRLPAPSEL